MDHSLGVQIPQGILPGVTVLMPGVALCLKHSAVDKRFIDSHIEQLSQNLPSELYPAFIALDTSAGTFEFVLEKIARYRAEALRNKRVFFLYSPFFAPRVNTLREHVDHLFYYGPGLSAPALFTEKLNYHRVPAIDQQVMMIQRTPKRAEERKRLNITLPPGVSSEEATHLIGELLSGRYSGQLDIETVNTNEQ